MLSLKAYLDRRTDFNKNSELTKLLKALYSDEKIKERIMPSAAYTAFSNPTVDIDFIMNEPIFEEYLAEYKAIKENQGDEFSHANYIFNKMHLRAVEITYEMIDEMCDPVLLTWGTGDVLPDEKELGAYLNCVNQFKEILAEKNMLPDCKCAFESEEKFSLCESLPGNKQRDNNFLKKHYEKLSKQCGGKLTWDYILAHPDVCWDRHVLSANPATDLKIIRNNPHFHWSYLGLSNNPNMTCEFVMANLGAPWSFDHLFDKLF